MKVYTLIVAVFTFMAILPEAGAWGSSRRTSDCLVTSWSEWSTPEGSDTTTRKRAILRHPSGGGAACPALKETKETNCSVASWSEWSTHEGSGNITRERAILRHPSGGGAPCPALKETKDSNCSVESWSEWSTPEGFGTITRERAILRHPSGGGAACPALKETKETNQLPSPKQTAASISKNFIRERVVVQNLEPLSRPLRTKRQVTGAVRDLLVIVDSSGSIGSGNFQIAKNQLGRLLGLLCPDPDPFNLNEHNHRAALLQFSTKVREEFDFDDNTGLPAIQADIGNMQYMGGLTCTGDAFRRAKAMFSPKRGLRNNDQLDVVREVLILTDGLSSTYGCESASAVQAAMDLKRDLRINATVFGLSIGNFHAKGQQEILSYVSEPAPQHLFALPDFRSFADVVGLIESDSSICQSFV